MWPGAMDWARRNTPSNFHNAGTVCCENMRQTGIFLMKSTVLQRYFSKRRAF